MSIFKSKVGIDSVEGLRERGKCPSKLPRCSQDVIALDLYNTIYKET